MEHASQMAFRAGKNLGDCGGLGGRPRKSQAPWGRALNK